MYVETTAHLQDGHLPLQSRDLFRVGCVTFLGLALPLGLARVGFFLYSLGHALALEAFGSLQSAEKLDFERLELLVQLRLVSLSFDHVAYVCWHLWRLGGNSGWFSISKINISKNLA